MISATYPKTAAQILPTAIIANKINISMVKKHGMHFAGSSKVKISEFFSMRSLKFYGDRYPVYYSYSSSIYHEILDQSLINDLEDFIFHHFEFTILCCSCKQGIGILLIDVFVFFLCVET